MHVLVRTFLAGPLLAGLFTLNLSAAPYTVAPTDNALTLAQAIAGVGINIVGTPTLTSQTGQSGTFTGFTSGPYAQTGGAAGQYTFASGAILTTGLAAAGTGTFLGGANVDMFGAGDAQLSTLIGSSTFDAAVLTFEFTTPNPLFTLSYAFASSEYPAFIGSPFIDAFAISINGVNAAVVPEITTPVSINSVNAATNSNWFTQYSNPFTPFNYGGLTTVLTASANVSTTSTNTVRIAIADGGDGSLDSAVLIQGRSSSAIPEPSAIILSITGFALLAGLNSFPRRKIC